MRIPPPPEALSNLVLNCAVRGIRTKSARITEATVRVDVLDFANDRPVPVPLIL